MDVYSAHYLRPILRILAERHKIAEAFLHIAKLKRARSRLMLRIAGGAKALQHYLTAYLPFVHGYYLILQVYFY